MKYFEEKIDKKLLALIRETNNSKIEKSQSRKLPVTLSGTELVSKTRKERKD